MAAVLGEHRVGDKMKEKVVDVDVEEDADEPCCVDVPAAGCSRYG